MRTCFNLLMCLLSLHLAAQTPLGPGINGQSAGDRFGWATAISANGQRLAAGAPYNSAGLNTAGQVRVFEWLNGAWMQIGQDINGTAANDLTGFSVALSSDGKMLAVGAPYTDSNGADAGKVQVYTFAGNTWIAAGAPLTGKAAGDRFGWSVSLAADGTRLAVGAPYHASVQNQEGQVLTFEWQNGQWAQIGQILDGKIAGEAKGWQVALSADGQRLVAGAPLGDNSPGIVYAYQWSNNAWEPMGDSIQGGAVFDQFGWATAISADGSRVAAGAVGNGGNGNNAGHVRVYQWQDGAWQQLGFKIDGEASGDRSGASVSLSADGNRIAIGAYLNDGNGNRAGHARIFDWNGNAWIQTGNDLDGKAPEDLFGNVLSLSADGSRLAVDATGNDDNGFQAGQVQVFQLPAITTNAGEAVAGTPDVFPNPVNDWLQIESAQQPEYILIYDIHGRICLFRENPGRQIDVSILPAGGYILQIGIERHRKTLKFLKE